ncbi:shikimate dehydrogenase family protein [Muricoccus pecuniae]|uniref:Shikimate dehydrogenase n=1 Tax=Muricoccus pecuniae TaxID=693023 RepID=A0A840YK54_9PROT|nr:shikimate dehydrogenase [Roseomonas pecuniae]MBB5695222.1 shikimate dehydrogenase [Roseomonas pecuniae]
MTITGRTRLMAILGDPVAPLRSPALFNQAFARLGMDAAFLAFEVPAGELPAAWAGLTRLRNLDGLVVTMPHKEAVVPLLDALGPTARLTGTVNTVRRRPEGGWEGEMFDGEGFRDGLERAGHPVRGSAILQVGCGAAGRAIAHALARAGAARLLLHDASPGRAASLAGLLSGTYPGLSVAEGRPETMGQDIVVNATPLGLREGDPLPLEVSRLRPPQVVADVIPNPEETPLIAAARAAGCAVVTGRSMHEGQARLAAAYLGIAGWEG